MKTLWHWLTGRRGQRRVIIKSILLAAPVTDKLRDSRIRAFFGNAGVQALVQALEQEAAYHQAQAIDIAIIAAGREGHAFHAGAAATLIEVISKIEHTVNKPDRKPDRKTDLEA